MNKEYKIKLDLNKKIYNKKMAFNQFDENVNDFYIEVTKNNEVVKDLDKSIITLVAIKPNGEVDAQFIEAKEGRIYADLKPSMCDLVGNYQAKAMIVLEGEIVTTDTINYSVNEDKIISKLNDDIVSDERFTLFTDALSRLSTIETNEEQRVINEAERILSEENRKIEEAKRVEAELIRQHEEADRAKYDSTRESNENIRKQNESIRLTNETNRIDEETKRVEEENKRKLAEEERNANYNFMTEDEDRRRLEANAHKEAEALRVQAETNRVNEEAKRRTTEQARVSAENTRVSNENTRKASEVTRQTNETQRVEAETQRKNRYNSFIADAEANANNFENYTNTAKVKEEERKSNELDRKSQEDRRVSNEVERISNENTRKANEKAREKNETSRQYVFENKVNEVDKKIVELNTTKDNFVSNINTKVDNKISEIDNVKDNFVSSISTKVDNKISELDSAKSDMTNTVSNKVNEVENRFNALTSKQQQDAEVIDARDGETSLKARLDRDIEKAKEIYAPVEGSHISTDSSVGYLKGVEILGNTIQSASNLADIRSVGDKVEGQELYEIPVLSVGKNLLNIEDVTTTNDGVTFNYSNGVITLSGTSTKDYITSPLISIANILHDEKCYRLSSVGTDAKVISTIRYMDGTNVQWADKVLWKSSYSKPFVYIQVQNSGTNCNGYKIQLQLEEVPNLDTQTTPYEPYQEDKLTILSPTQLEKVGDVCDRIIEKDGVWGVEKNVPKIIIDDNSSITLYGDTTINTLGFYVSNSSVKNLGISNFAKSVSDVAPGGKFVLEEEAFSCNFGTAKVSIFKNRLTSPTINGIKAYLKDNPIIIYSNGNKSDEFIPLPHDQQVKLRTFANKTNISFLTEIEGTIKAQVPKSIGATVNTHTEQIRSLNNELNRVKKLEESTVSTVTTESDFTTVEATSNGYFEDVKLEGKTLVNLATQPTNNGSVNHQYATISTVTNIKPSTEYTYIIRNNGSETLKLYLNHNGGFDWFDLDVEANSTVIGKARSLPTIDGDIWLSLKKAETVEQNLQVVLLEGDHTQNPPSYFEGLKSVGQSATTSEDGADEIVVSSVKGDGNLWSIDNVYYGDVNTATGKLNPEAPGVVTSKQLIPVNSTNIYAIGYDKDETLRLTSFFCYDKFKQYLGIAYNNKLLTNTFFIRPRFVKTDFSPIDKASVSVSLSKTEEGLSTPYQSDKKRLLYYNNETQAWEKPILRQWDSIEKHADGKYYYHQRSGEVVLNGSENWEKVAPPYTEDANIYFCCRVLDTVSVKRGEFISDKFNKEDVYNTDKEGLYIYNTSTYKLRINIMKSKLSSQDVQGFKQWLQANNVTVVYKLAQEKVYECTNIDLITYANETNYVVESGVLSPKTTLKVHNNISNVVRLLQKKVSLLESNVTSYMITQNRLMLASRYNADTVSFKVDVASFSDTFEYDNDLYELILNNILVGKDNYNREYIENLTRFYWMDFVISDEMYSTLFELIEEQHNPKIEETPLI